MEAATLDMDHCLPWSAWPCGNVWNLLQTRRVVNQHEKRDRLPVDGRIRAAGAAIQAQWPDTYLLKDEHPLPHRFTDEARASVPGLTGPSVAPLPDKAFDALQVQGLRVRHDQQVPKWTLSMPAH